MYKCQPRINLFKEKVDNQNKFLFEEVSLCDVVKEIQDINPKNHQSYIVFLKIQRQPPEVLCIKRCS